MVLLGDGELREALEFQISNLGLSDAIKLPGFVEYEDLPAYYGLASAFIHASTVEQWGLVVNEAMAAGLPVLVSERSGCVTDLVRHGENGFTFDPYRTEQLAELMLRLTSDDVDLESMRRASVRIIAKWGPDRFARGLVDAVHFAMQVPVKRVEIMDKLLLASLKLR